jgi:hypothetical protein
VPGVNHPQRALVEVLTPNHPLRVGAMAAPRGEDGARIRRARRDDSKVVPIATTLDRLATQGDFPTRKVLQHSGSHHGDHPDGR